MKIVILTPVPIEHEAVLSHLKDIDDEIIGGRYYIKGSFQGKHHRFSIFTEQTGSTNPTISNAVAQAISNFSPAAILLVGIAGGVKDADIGDIVVGTKSYGYEVGKETETGLLARPESYMGSKDLEAVAKSVKFRKQWFKRSPFANEKTKVYFGPIAGGEKVVATAKGQIASFLKKNYNDTLAVEMEAYGFGQALVYHQNIRWLNIRSISDLLSGKKEADSGGSQAKAAANAAAFAFELLYTLDGRHFNIVSSDSDQPRQSIHVENSENVIIGDINAGGSVSIGNNRSIDTYTETSSEASSSFSKKIPSTLEGIKNCLQEDDIKNALEGLLIITKDKDPDLHNDIIAQSGRWNRLRREKRQGVITTNEAQILHNRIHYALLGIIEDLEG